MIIINNLQMRNLFFLIFFYATTCFSQISQDKQFFESIKDTTNKLPYVICIQSDGYNVIEKVISKKNIFNKNDPTNHVELTSKELLYIKGEIAKNKNYVFSKTTFPDAIFISKDTLKSYSSNISEQWHNEQKVLIESQDTVKYAQFRKEKPYPCMLTFVHFYSKPIYFRNNTLCIIYHANLCGFHNSVGGCYQVMLFNKINGVWKMLLETGGGCY